MGRFVDELRLKVGLIMGMGNNRNKPCQCGSGKKLKKCCGSPMRIQEARSRTNVVFTEEASPICFRDLSAALREYNPLSVGVAVSSLAINGIAQDGIQVSRSTHHVWHLGALTVASFYSRPDLTVVRELGEVPALSSGAREKMLSLVLGLLGLSRLSAQDQNERRIAATNDLMRVLCCQTTMQGAFVSQTAQQLILLEVFDLTTNQILDNSVFDPLFKAKFGCSTLEYISLMYGLWVASLSSTLMNSMDLFKSSENAEKLHGLLVGFARAHSVDCDKVTEVVDELYGVHEVEALPQALYSETPLIRVADSQYLLPPHPFMRLLASKGSFFKALYLARKDAEMRGEAKPHINTYSERMGGTYERIVKEVLSMTESRQIVYEEYEYLDGNNAKSPDFVVFSEESKHVVLIQAKLKRLSPGAFYGYDFTAFQDDARGALAQSISRSIRYLYKLESACASGHLKKETEIISKEVKNAKKIILLGIMPAIPSVFRIDRFRETLWKGVVGDLRPEELEWHERNKARIIGWHIIETEEMSEWVSCRVDTTLFQTLENYFAAVDFRMDQTSMPSSLGDWIVKNTPAERRFPHRKLVDCYSRFAEWAQKYLFGGA